MKLTFLGANHEVTGSCTLLEAAGQRYLIDCGMEQGKNVYENQPLPVAPGEIDGVLVTHAHIDHTGQLPLLVRNGFRGRIYATKPTAQTLPTFRSLKLNGRTARRSVPVPSRWSRCTPCRMPRRPCSCSGAWSITLRSNWPRAL